VGYKPGIGFVLLLGERRWAAMVQTGRPLFAYTVRTWEEVYAWLMLDVDQPGRTQMTVSELVAVINKISTCVKVKKNVYLDDVICAYAQVDKERMQETRAVLKFLGPEYPEGIRSQARAEMVDIEAGRIRPSSAYGRIKKALDRVNSPALPAEQQRKILTNASAAAAGLADALQTLGPPSPDLTTEERRSFADQLARARLRLEQTINALRKGQTS
jgi:hypothetical protein